MIRVILINLILFALPFLIYGGYLYFVRGTRDGQAIINEAPLAWLFATGTFLVFATLLSLVDFSGADPDQVYVPPTVKDGKIVPGHFKRVETGHRQPTKRETQKPPVAQ